MKVAIVGSGAVGLLVASFLCESKIETILYTNRDEQAEQINREGIQIYRNGDMCRRSMLKAVSFKHGIDPVDLIIVTVKQYNLQPIIDYLVKVKHPSPILFLQNGLSHTYEITRLHTNTILLGIVEHGVLKLTDTSVKHTGVGRVKISCFRGELDALTSLLDVLNDKGYIFKVEKEWYPVLIRKLVVNAVINPLTVLYNSRNGELLENPYYYKNMQLLYHEILSVIFIDDKQQLWEELVTICQKTSANYSSMYMDIKNNRQTEVESILGYLLSEGKKKNQEMPLTSFLYHSIKGKENLGRGHTNG